MEAGETLSAANSIGRNVCAICGGEHDDPKRIEFTETAGKDGWAREESMAGKLEKIPPKVALYPGGNPAAYPTEGHHCIAYSAFVSKGKDVILRLNFLLNKGGYKPNRDENCILLPGRPDYHAFWRSIDLGRPLQMHIGNHSRSFFTQSRNILVSIANMYKGEVAFCEDEELSETINDLKQLVRWGENYAFVNIASSSALWTLHPKHTAFALRMYCAPPSQIDVSPTARAIAGHGGKKLNNREEPTWPKPELDVGIFAT